MTAIRDQSISNFWFMKEVRKDLKSCGNLDIKLKKKDVPSDKDCEIRSDMLIYKDGVPIARVAKIKEPGAPKVPSFSSELINIGHYVYDAFIGIHPNMIYLPYEPEISKELFENKIYNKNFLLKQIEHIQEHPLYDLENFKLLPTSLQDYLKTPLNENEYFKELKEKIEKEEEFMEEKRFEELVKDNKKLGNFLALSERLDSLSFHLHNLPTWFSMEKSTYGVFDFPPEEMHKKFEFKSYDLMIIQDGPLTGELGFIMAEEVPRTGYVDVGYINGRLVDGPVFPLKQRLIEIVLPEEVFPKGEPVFLLNGGEQQILEHDLYLDPFRYETNTENKVPIFTGLFNLTDNENLVSAGITLHWIQDLNPEIVGDHYPMFKNYKGESWGVVAELLQFSEISEITVLNSPKEGFPLLVVPEFGVYRTPEEVPTGGNVEELEPESKPPIIDHSPPVVEEPEEVLHQYKENDKVIWSKAPDSEEQPFTILKQKSRIIDKHTNIPVRKDAEVDPSSIKIVPAYTITNYSKTSSQLLIKHKNVSESELSPYKEGEITETFEPESSVEEPPVEPVGTGSVVEFRWGKKYIMGIIIGEVLGDTRRKDEEDLWQIKSVKGVLFHVKKDDVEPLSSEYREKFLKAYKIAKKKTKSKNEYAKQYPNTKKR